MILEDNDSDFELIKRELHNIDLNNTIEWAHDKGTFLQALDTFAPNIILLDYSLPGFDGLSALSLVRQRFPDIPAIIVSGAIGEEIAIETLKAGATDYVLKQRLNRLRPVVHRALQESEQLIERKRMEEELKWHSELLDLAPVLVLDMDGRIILWNTGAEEMYGWTKGEAIGSVSHDLLKTEFPMPLEEIMAELMENGHWRGELSHIKHDGSHISVSSHWILHRDSQGKPIAILEINNDITDLKFAEDELKKARDELELRVQERTAELVKTNEELLNAKEVAEEAVKAKAAFLANMSHELRTPMNSIIGFTSLLLMEPLPPEYKDWLDNMRMNGEALLALINDVLDFSKMEKEMIVLELHPFDLRHRIEESLDLVSTKAADKGLDLAYIMDINVPETIIGDSARLRQVLANLLSNAVKFTDTGDVLVHVSSKREGDIHEVHFAVQDTGIGMPQEQMNKLFQPFSQISLAPSRLNEGTGLGLAISKKLVELMGGKIWAQSEVGKGSTFIFTIKAKAATEDSVTKLPDGPQLQLAKRNILIVDDNPTMRRLLGRQTKTWGMVPLVASLSYSAIELIQKGITPEVAIIDASMPDLDGIVLAEKIHSLRSDLPLIILTSAGQHIPQDLPAVSLTKPIKPMQLYDCLTSILAGRPIREQYKDQAVDPASVNPLRILLAEDNISSQMVTQGMLKKLGYRADIAANGLEVIQALERQPYDIILMDIKMPEMDGYEATKQIRQRWPDNGPRIIAITAYALKGDREKCLEAGMDDYIGKPVEMKDLADVLRRCPTPLKG